MPAASPLRRRIEYRSSNEAVNPALLYSSPSFMDFAVGERVPAAEAAEGAFARFRVAYNLYADSVLSEIDEYMPEQSLTCRVLLEAAQAELQSVWGHMCIWSQNDAEKTQKLLLGVVEYMHAAEELENREAMLVFAVEELKSSLNMLGLLSPLTQDNAWEQHQNTIAEKLDESASVADRAASVASQVAQRVTSFNTSAPENHRAIRLAA